MGICQFSAIFYICLNIFVNGFVYSWWGQGNGLIITVSILQLLSASFTLLLALTRNLKTLRVLYDIRFVFIGVASLSQLPILLVTVLSFVAYSESDQLAMLVLNSNILSFSSFTAVPFTILCIITVFLWQMRYFEILDQEIKFGTKYHFGPGTSKATRKAKSTKESRDLTIKLLMRYLEEPSA